MRRDGPHAALYARATCRAQGPGFPLSPSRGPQRAIVVRRKRRALGLWVNRDSVAFRNVPEYYAIAASRPRLACEKAFFEGGVAARMRESLPA